MEDLAVFVALNHSGFFRMYFVKFKKINKYVIYRLRVSPYGKKLWPRPCGLGQHFQDLGHSFSPYRPPSPQITYIYIYVLTLYLLLTQCLHYINLHYLQYIYYNTSTLVK